MLTKEHLWELAQAHLEPGETLCWAGQGNLRHIVPIALRQAALPFLAILAFGGFAAYNVWQMNQDSARFWAAHSHPGWASPASGVEFLFPLVFFGGFGVFIAVLIVAMQHETAKAITYAVTDRRIMFLTTGHRFAPAQRGGGVIFAEYSSGDIQFVRRRGRRNGTDDILFARPDAARTGKAVMEIGGLSLPLPLRAPDIGFFGIADGETVEALIHALDAAHRTEAAPLLIPQAAMPTEGERMAAEGEQVVTLTKHALPPVWVGVLFFGSGALFFGNGLSIAFGLMSATSGGAPASPLEGGLLFAGFGLIFALIGLGILLWRNEMTVDRVARTYRMTRGFLPLAQPVQGTFADFERLRFERKEQPDSESSQIHILWTISLLWKEAGRKPYRLLTTPLAPDAREQSRRFVRTLDLPLEDRTGEPLPSEKKKAAALADPKTPARNRRAACVKITLGVVLCLVVLNSILKGVVLEERWTDEKGQPVVRRSTLFWTETSGRSAAGQTWSSMQENYLVYSSFATAGNVPDLSGKKQEDRWALRLGSQPVGSNNPPR